MEIIRQVSLNGWKGRGVGSQGKKGRNEKRNGTKRQKIMKEKKKVNIYKKKQYKM